MAEQPQRLAGAFQHRGQQRRRVQPGAVQQVADLDQVLQRQQKLLRRSVRHARHRGGTGAPARPAGSGAPASSRPPPPAPRRRRSRPSASPARRGAWPRPAGCRPRRGHPGPGAPAASCGTRPWRWRRGNPQWPSQAETRAAATSGAWARVSVTPRTSQSSARSRARMPGGVGAQRAQVAQPGEAMRGGAPGDRAGGVVPAVATRLQPAGGCPAPRTRSAAAGRRGRHRRARGRGRTAPARPAPSPA